VREYARTKMECSKIVVELNNAKWTAQLELEAAAWNR
jgi:hypothetical protein